MLGEQHGFHEVPPLWRDSTQSDADLNPPYPEEHRGAMRFEGWDSPMLQDAHFWNTPQHEAGRAQCQLHRDRRDKPGDDRQESVRFDVIITRRENSEGEPGGGQKVRNSSLLAAIF